MQRPLASVTATQTQPKSTVTPPRLSPPPRRLSPPSLQCPHPYPRRSRKAKPHRKHKKAERETRSPRLLRTTTTLEQGTEMEAVVACHLAAGSSDGAPEPSHAAALEPSSCPARFHHQRLGSPLARRRRRHAQRAGADSDAEGDKAGSKGTRARPSERS